MVCWFLLYNKVNQLYKLGDVLRVHSGLKFLTLCLSGRAKGIRSRVSHIKKEYKTTVYFDPTDKKPLRFKLQHMTLQCGKIGGIFMEIVLKCFEVVLHSILILLILHV